MSNELDDDLQGLLEELELDESTTTPEPTTPPGTTTTPEPIVIPTPVMVEPDPVAEREPDSDLLVPEEQNNDIIDLRAFIRNHDADYDETKNNLRCDRAKADMVVRVLLDRVSESTATAQETEALVSAVKCLIDSNGHMVRLLDSKTKLLQSQKGAIGALIQNNVGVSGAELADILSQNIGDDEV